VNIQKVFKALTAVERAADEILKTTRNDGGAFKALYVELVAGNGDRVKIQLGDMLWLTGAK
jgi:hypothetical protein